MAFMPSIRKILDLLHLSRTIAALHPQSMPFVPHKRVYVHLFMQDCLCSSMLLFLTPPILPTRQMDSFNKSLFTPAKAKAY